MSNIYVFSSGPLKDLGMNKSDTTSILKSSSSQSSLESKSKPSPDSPYASTSGAQLLAEENVNTVKRSPKKSNISNSATVPALPTTDAPSLGDTKHIPDKHESPSKEDTTVKTKLKTTKTKSKKKKKVESDYSSSDQTDASKSNEDTTVIQTIKQGDTIKETETKSSQSSQVVSSLNENIVSSKIEPILSIPSTSKLEQVPSTSTAMVEVKQESSTLTVKPKISSQHALKKEDNFSSESGPSSFRPLPLEKRPSSASSTTPKDAVDSSGDSGDDEKMVLSQRVSLERHQLLPNLLTKVNSTYQEFSSCGCF